MTPDQVIKNLEWFLAQAKHLKMEGESENMDWGSLMQDIEDTFKSVSISQD